MKIRPLAFASARAVPVYPRVPAYAVAILLGVAVLASVAGLPFAGLALAIALGVGVAVTGWWVWREVLPAQSTDGTVTRRGDREQRAGGVASFWDVQERASRAELRRRAGVLRPSLAGVRWWSFNPYTVGVLVARIGLGLRWGQQLWSSCEDTTLRIGGPRTGKTLSLAQYGRTAPGALVVTSTRFDLPEHVHRDRRVYEDGSERRIHIFNPSGWGYAPSTVRWSILVGCEDFATAARRAGDLIPEARSVEGERWDRLARLYLPILLHAAALSSGRVEDVLRWVREIGQDSMVDKVRHELVDILAPAVNGLDLAGLLHAFLAYPDRTRGSVTGMMTPALGWMTDPAAREIGAAYPLDSITLDVPTLIRDRETLHILGPSQVGSHLAPLTSALVAEIAEQARVMASRQQGGRLDPPLTMLLDEAAVSVRLPLDRWSADMGGRGVTLHMSAQSLSQLEECWGAAGAQSLLGNTGTLVLYGGGKDAMELKKVSLLCGERHRRVVQGGEDIDGDGEKWEKVPVLTVAQLSNMPPGEAAILKRNLGGVFVGHPPQVNDDRRWKTCRLDDVLPAQHVPAWEPEPAREDEHA